MEEKNKKNIDEMLSGTKVVDVNVEGEIKKSFIAYAMAVNVSRAIPDVRDGLKPVHRRILYDMYNELSLTSDKPYRKCALIVGDVLGKFHPHGDSSVYDALVRLAQDFSIRCTLVDGHGNFGSVDGDPPAAYRYTEARLSKIAVEMLRDIEKKTVDFYPNFDDTREQPVVLPSRYPNLLVNGSDGIAVGMATSIPPHNLGEVINGTIALLDNPEMDIDELIEYIPAPEVNKAKLIESIAELVKQKRIEGISDVHEQSDRDGMRIVIEVKKDVSPQVVLNLLFKHTQMQISNPMIMLALVDGRPKMLNLKEILEEYIKHQKDVVTRRTRYDLEKAQEREHILIGLVKALANIDEVVELLKKSRDRADAVVNLTQRFELSEKQANAILDMRLQRLTSLEVEKLQAELAELEKLITDLKDILANPARVVDIIKTEMSEIRDRYADKRRSEISIDYSDLDIEDLIEQEDIVVTVTHDGYIKRLAVDEYRTQRRGGVGVTALKTKEEDFVENVIATNTHVPLLFFSNKGKVYRIKGWQIPETGKNSKGRAMVNLLTLDDGEKINAYVPMPADSQGYLTMATKGGLIKRTSVEEFARINTNGKIAISLTEGDELIGVQLTSGEDELLMASTGGKCIRFAEADVRPTGRTSQGVRSIKMDAGEEVVDMTKVKDGVEVFTLTQKGYGKRSDIAEYSLQGRAGKGVKAGKLTDKTGNIVNLKLVDPASDDIIIIADNGITIRIHADEVSKMSRATQGVKVMRLKDESAQVVACAIVPRSEDEEVTHLEEGAAEEAENAAESNGAETKPEE